MLPPALFLLPLLAAADPIGRVEMLDVRVETFVASQVYHWEVTNLGTAPIERVQLRLPLTYDLAAPEGWTYDYADSIFIARADRIDYAIHPDRTLRFQGRATSAGGPITQTDMTLGFSRDDREIVISGVLAPGPRPRSLVWSVALTVALIGLVQTMLIVLQRRRSASAGK